MIDYIFGYIYDYLWSNQEEWHEFSIETNKGIIKIKTKFAYEYLRNYAFRFNLMHRPIIIKTKGKEIVDLLVFEGKV